MADSIKSRRLLDLQQSFTDLCETGTGKAKSAALDSLMEQLAAAVWAGFQKRELWNLLCEVGYTGSYNYFAKKLATSGVIRKRIAIFPHKSENDQLTRPGADSRISRDSTIIENRAPPLAGPEISCPGQTPEAGQATAGHAEPVPSESAGSGVTGAEREGRPEWQIRRESVRANLRLEEERAEQLRQELAKKDTGFRAPEFKPPQR